MPDADREVLVLPSWTAVEGGKGLFGGSAPQPIKLSRLKESFASFFASLDEIIGDVPEGPGAFTLEEIEVTVALSAEGSIALIAGAKAGASGGITLRLKR